MTWSDACSLDSLFFSVGSNSILSQYGRPQLSSDGVYVVFSEKGNKHLCLTFFFQVTVYICGLYLIWIC